MGFSIKDIIEPLEEMIPDKNLYCTLSKALERSKISIREIEYFFDLLPARRPSQEFLATFFNSWKATHLKMLAIYGLSCRLQRSAFKADSRSKDLFFCAAAHNAETSYEDLGIDFEGQTHAQLYDVFADYFLPNLNWSAKQYSLPNAFQFKEWIYQNMVVKDIQIGLLTNMFSEIYNHCEYTIALSAFSRLIDDQYAFCDSDKEKALQYICAHVADETEKDHFLVVVKALQEYCQATQQGINYATAQTLFEEYLIRLGSIMSDLTSLMQRNTNLDSLILAS